MRSSRLNSSDIGIDREKFKILTKKRYMVEKWGLGAIYGGCQPECWKPLWWSFVEFRNVSAGGRKFDARQGLGVI